MLNALHRLQQRSNRVSIRVLPVALSKQALSKRSSRNDLREVAKEREQMGVREEVDGGFGAADRLKSTALKGVKRLYFRLLRPFFVDVIQFVYSL